MPNLVPIPPQGIVVALQYWREDEARAMRLARLLADIEPGRRDNVLLAFVRRFDMPETALLHETQMYCGFKFGTMTLRATREGTGHPWGPNELWSSCMEQFSGAWRDGQLAAHSIFTCEPDGCPLRVDWLDRLLEAHRRTLDAGKRITGPGMQQYPHLNGSLLSHLSVWQDRPSLHQTPPSQSWDMYHARVILAEGLPTTWAKNIYGACEWSAPSLNAMAKETAWLCSQKDDSAIDWAERRLLESDAPGFDHPAVLARGPRPARAPEPAATPEADGDVTAYASGPRVSVRG